MTGEISLRGLVLPVGGIKEKTVAAHRAGIRKVLLPARNRKDLEDVPQSVRDEVQFVFCERVDDVVREALGIEFDVTAGHAAAATSRTPLRHRAESIDSSTVCPPRSPKRRCLAQRARASVAALACAMQHLSNESHCKIGSKGVIRESCSALIVCMRNVRDPARSASRGSSSHRTPTRPRMHAPRGALRRNMIAMDQSLSYGIALRGSVFVVTTHW